MQEIADIAGVAGKGAIADLQTRLKAVGTEYRRVISITPCDLPGAPSGDTLSQRLAWVDAQLLNPVERLLEALEPENRHMLSLWPEEPNADLIPDYDEIAEQLENLQLLGKNLAIIIAKYRFHDLPPGPLIRYRIVAAIAEVLDDALPDLRPSRGTYDVSTKQFHGVYPALIRRIFLEITGLHEQLDRLIKEQVDERRQR
ncbi:hypothetical protein V5F89_11925 [Pelagerythrobacter marensis]|uniref:Uncharacterized protein n=1 Tax=Pelagerythrobacter marensis TaxID=543877 RepID=A0ABZ2D1R8_9SPHN